MKTIPLLLVALFVSFASLAQRTVPIKNLWTRPQVHVLFQGYVLSFAIRDIDRAMALLYETGDTTWGTASGLDTGGNYGLELYAGLHLQYRGRLQRLMQRGVGAYLLLAGHAVVMNPKHKILKEMTADISMAPTEEQQVLINFYDPKSHKILFSGSMKMDMYNKDLGLYEDY